MFAPAIIGILYALAQIQVPSEEPLVIELTGGELLYGFTDVDVLDSGSRTGIQVNLDAPWLRELERQKLLRLDRVQNHRRERPTARKSRYLTNGYVLIDGPRGMLAVEKSEYDYAQRSNELASALAREPRDTGGSQIQFAQAPSAERPGLIEQWKRHFIVAGASAALALFVARTLLVRRDAPRA